MSVTVTMPQMGESVVEGTLERWLVRKGERVEKDQIICEITTDKVDAEVPAPEAGVITSVLVEEGATVEVGAELAVIDPAGTQTQEKSAKAEQKPKAEPAERAASAAKPRPSDAEKPAARARSAEAPGAASGDTDVRATPLARRVAEARGIDLGSAPASGSGGRVTRADLDAAERGAPAAAAQNAPAKPAEIPALAPGSLLEFLAKMRVPTHRVKEGEREQPFSSIRKRIAEHMVVSKIVSPHVGTVAEVDLAKLVRLRDAKKAAFRKEHGFNLSYLPFVVQATVRALKDFPVMNSTVVGNSLIERNGIHVGVAVETERGLLVPVVRDADRLSLVGIAQRIEELAEAARSRSIGADDLQGGTFTVSNPGREGNLYGFAVINQPQVGILRMGEVKKTPVVVETDGEDTIAIHPIMYMALSYDHRVVDGVTGNGFLHRVARNLESAEFEV